MSRVFLRRQILVSSKNCSIIFHYWEPPCLGFMLTCCLFQINSLDMLRKKWLVSKHLSGTKWWLLMLFSWNEESMGVDIQVHLPEGGETQVGAGYFYLASKHVQMYVAQSTNVSWCVREGHGSPIMEGLGGKETSIARRSNSKRWQPRGQNYKSRSGKRGGQRFLETQ